MTVKVLIRPHNILILNVGEKVVAQRGGAGTLGEKNSREPEGPLASVRGDEM